MEGQGNEVVLNFRTSAPPTMPIDDGFTVAGKTRQILIDLCRKQEKIKHKLSERNRKRTVVSIGSASLNQPRCAFPGIQTASFSLRRQGIAAFPGQGKPDPPAAPWAGLSVSIRERIRDLPDRKLLKSQEV